ncbi:hypothetical protein BEP19_16430 [Ammoniphilus oxalaticus]|uniref:IDEAL domain-containing protein n=1 Tax=Ammoniphilus oxalaticus TaxID=66863 RepID=A0A419SQK0_9BACL|nr:hypothetical protein [Ammoniphilus oxalaticus]RKD26784.1 hypothetical protein BEP19_16430 [Ammoniphilus oxalaticus]
MKLEEKLIGQWIEFKYKDYLGQEWIGVGYVTIFSQSGSYVKVYDPTLRRTFNVPIKSITVKEDPHLKLDDINCIIDLALDRRDWNWLRELRAKKESMLDAQ